MRDAGDAGRVFFRSVENELIKHLHERDKPARAAAVERAYDEIGREARVRKRERDPHRAGLEVARRIVANLHPDKMWRMAH